MIFNEAPPPPPPDEDDFVDPPVRPASPFDIQPPDDADEYALAPAGPVVDFAPVVSAPVAAASPMLGYATRKPLTAPEQEALQQSRFGDLYLPLILVTAGVFLSFVDASARGIRTPLMASLYVTLSIAMNLALIFPALLAATRLLDLGLGTIGTAMLKVAAVAILPGAIAGILSVYTFGLLTWGVSLLGYYILLAYLFEMDGREIRITTTIIWLSRFVVNLLLVGVILSALMRGQSIPGAALAAGSTPGSGLIPPAVGAGIPGADPLASSDDVDKETTEAVAAGKLVEAREWCKPQFTNHMGLKLQKEGMLALAEQFYAAGAVKVYCAYPVHLGDAEMCAEMIVEMPPSAAARRAVLDVNDKQSGAEKPSADSAGRYLVVTLD